MAAPDTQAATVLAVAALAEELMSFNPGHGDYLTAGRRLAELLESSNA